MYLRQKFNIIDNFALCFCVTASVDYIDYWILLTYSSQDYIVGYTRSVNGSGTVKVLQFALTSVTSRIRRRLYTHVPSACKQCNKLRCRPHHNQSSSIIIMHYCTPIARSNIIQFSSLLVWKCSQEEPATDTSDHQMDTSNKGGFELQEISKL